MLQEREKEILLRAAYHLSLDHLSRGAVHLPTNNRQTQKAGKWINSLGLQKNAMVLRTLLPDQVRVSVYVYKDPNVVANTQPTWSVHYVLQVFKDEIPRLYCELITPDGAKRKWFNAPDDAIKALLAVLTTSQDGDAVVKSMPPFDFDFEARYMLD